MTVPADHSPPPDEGLPRERTALAWSRTILVANGLWLPLLALQVHRQLWVLAAASAVAAGAVAWRSTIATRHAELRAERAGSAYPLLVGLATAVGPGRRRRSTSAPGLVGRPRSADEDGGRGRHTAECGRNHRGRQPDEQRVGLLAVATGAPGGITTVDYRVRNNYLDHQGRWGETRQSSGSDLIAYPNPPEGD